MINNNKIEQIRINQEDKCNICKFKLTTGKFHVDHIIPKKDGGGDNYNNLQILCISCHSKKNEKDGINARYPQYSFIEECPHCGKVIGGYNEDHAKYLLSQHLFIHFKIIDGKLIKKGGKDGK